MIPSPFPSIRMMTQLKRGRLVSMMRQMLMSTIKWPCLSPRSRTSSAHHSRPLCCPAWLRSWKRSSVQRSWRDVSPGLCGGKQDGINDTLMTAGRNWPSSRNASWRSSGRWMRSIRSHVQFMSPNRSFETKSSLWKLSWQKQRARAKSDKRRMTTSQPGNTTCECNGVSQFAC